MAGLVLPGHRILVASPHLGNQIFIEVQKFGRDERTPARLLLFDPDGPLALLTVEDPAFWEGLAPLPFAESLPTEGEALVHRWLGQGQFEAAPGTVRQIKIAQHGISRVALLSLELTLTMEGNGDSEVVTAHGQVVGLITAKSGDSFTAIAAPALRQFLEAAQVQPYPGFARVGIGWQDLTNPAFRKMLGLRSGEGGIRITRVLPHGSGGGVLEVGDVLLKVGGMSVDRTGQIDHPRYGRILFAALATDGMHPGDSLDVEVLRGGERRKLTLTLRRMDVDQDVVPSYLYGRGPDYLVLGGLVFEDLRAPYLGGGANGRRVPPRVLIAQDRDGANFSQGGERIVLLTSVLPDAANLGYQDLRDLIVTRVNDQPARSLADIRQAFQHPMGGFHVIEFLPGQGPERIVLDVAEAEAATRRIEERYGVGEGKRVP